MGSFVRPVLTQWSLSKRLTTRSALRCRASVEKRRDPTMPACRLATQATRGSDRDHLVLQVSRHPVNDR